MSSRRDISSERERQVMSSERQVMSSERQVMSSERHVVWKRKTRERLSERQIVWKRSSVQEKRASNLFLFRRHVFQTTSLSFQETRACNERLSETLVGNMCAQPSFVSWYKFKLENLVQSKFVVRETAEFRFCVLVDFGGGEGAYFMWKLCVMCVCVRVCVCVCMCACMCAHTYLCWCMRSKRECWCMCSKRECLKKIDLLVPPHVLQ